jgi:hypothetical protein
MWMSVLTSRKQLCTLARKTGSSQINNRNIQLRQTTCLPFTYYQCKRLSFIYQGPRPFLIISSVGQSSSWKANTQSTAHDIPRVLLNPKVDYRIHNCQQLVPIPRQINTIHSLPSDVFNIHFNIILPFKPRYSKWSLSFRFPHQTPLCISHPPERDRLILFGLITRIIGALHNSSNSSRLLSTTHLNHLFPARHV